jgi:hypothetical protein
LAEKLLSRLRDEENNDDKIIETVDTIETKTNVE